MGEKTQLSNLKSALCLYITHAASGRSLGHYVGSSDANTEYRKHQVGRM